MYNEDDTVEGVTGASEEVNDRQRLENMIREFHDRVMVHDWETALDFMDEDVQVNFSGSYEWLRGKDEVAKFVARTSPNPNRSVDFFDFEVEMISNNSAMATFMLKETYASHGASLPVIRAFPSTVVATLFAGEWYMRMLSYII